MASRPLRVLTWNLQGSAGLDIATAAAVVAAQSPDVVALQEVQRRQAARLAGVLGMSSRRWAFKHWPVRHRAEGLAVLSPHRIEWSARFTLRRAPLWDWRRRIGIEAHVVRDDGRCALIVLHLSPHDAAPARFAEAAAVLARASGGELPPLICGDLNDHPGEVAHAAFVQAGWVDAWEAVHGGAPGSDGATNWTAGPRAGRRPTQRIDYVLAPPGSTVEECDVAVGGADLDELASLSDHLPLVASIRVGPTP